MSISRKKQAPIAIVGMSTLFPGSADATSFWRDIVSGKDRITDVPPTHWLIEDFYSPDLKAPDKTYCKRGGFVNPIAFDSIGFGVPPNTVPATDSSQLLALIVAKRVLEDACRGQFKDLNRDRVSVILGVTGGTELVGEMAGRMQRPILIKALREEGVPEALIQQICERVSKSYSPWQEATFPGLLGNVVAGRIANRLDLHGTNCILDAACASSLAALSLAVKELSQGDSDLVISGGVDSTNGINMYMYFSKTPALSRTGDCRPFAADADGTLIGEGLGMFALKRLEDAERDGDHIYGVIKAIGSSSDGSTKSIYAPSADGQVVALKRTYESAGYGPETVELVEAHGTGTKAGDKAEITALKEVFDHSGREDRQWCAIGSVKSQIGHTKAAAGSAGLFKAVMALHHKVLPGTIKVHTPNPDIEFPKSPFFLNAKLRPWIRDSRHPRRASVSAFGFGGSNFHLTVEEYHGAGNRPNRVRTTDSELLLVSGDSKEDVLKKCVEISATCELAGALSHHAYISQREFKASQKFRLAIVATDEADLRAKILRATGLVGKQSGVEAVEDPTGIYFGSGTFEGEVAFLFPGQGSQFLNMGAELAIAFEPFRAVWDKVSSLGRSGPDRLERTVFPVPAFSDDEVARQDQRLTDTTWAQPAIGVTSLAYLELLKQAGIQASCVAGHSYGELTALYAAGALDLNDFLRCSFSRGKQMAFVAAHTPGAMTAVNLPAGEIETLLKEWGALGDEKVVIANFNSPKQNILSGTVELILDVEARLAKAGIKFTRLPVSTAFHSHLVAKATEPFHQFLNQQVTMKPAQLPVFTNSGAQPYSGDPAVMKECLAHQLSEPVHFSEIIERMYERGVRLFVEVGPRNILTSRVSECLSGRPYLAVSVDQKSKSQVAALWSAFGKLASRGIDVKLEHFWDGYGEPAMPQPVKRPVAAIDISGTNYGKPYPPKAGVAALPKAQPQSPPVAQVVSPPAARPAPQPIQKRETPKEVFMSDRENEKPASSPAMPEDVWLRAFETVQREARLTQESLQRSLVEAHTAYLNTLAPALAALAEIRPGAKSASAPVAHASAAPAARNGTGAVATRMAPAPVATTAARPRPQPQVLPRTQPTASVTPISPAVAKAVAPPSGGSTIDLAALKQVVLEIVADKTGYPADAIDLDLDLEGGLGIDSIKRVEILSAIQDKAPNLPDVNPAEMITLRSLNQILMYLESKVGGAKAPAAEPAADADEKKKPPEGGITRFNVVVNEARPSGFAVPNLLGQGTLLVVPDAQGVSEQLLSKLAARGIRSAAGTDAGPQTSGIIYLAGIGPFKDADQALAASRQAFVLAKQVAERFAKGPGLFVTVQDTGGDFGRGGGAGANPGWTGGLAGLTKTAGLEWPQATVKAIDLHCAGRTPDQLAEALLQELLFGAGETEVGLRADGSRVKLDTAAQAATKGTSSPAVTQDSVILVSGGARGVTAGCVIALAAATKARFVLLGRTALSDESALTAACAGESEIRQVLVADVKQRGEKLMPAEVEKRTQALVAIREVKATLKALGDAGASARYCNVNVQDAAPLKAALDPIRKEWGPITGFIHGAGVLADKLLTEKTPEQFDYVFNTKIGGLRALLAITAEDPLKLMVFFSSVAARWGNAGQADYAMANDILNRLAWSEARRRGPSCRVKSINWGPWAGGMVKPALRTQLEKRNVAMIPLEDGARRFVDEVQSSASDDVEIVIGDDLRKALAAGKSADEVRSFNVCLDAGTYPSLLDHQIKGRPVVPMVQAIEWFAQAGQAILGVERCSVKQVKVLKGIQLEEGAVRSKAYRVVCTPSAPGWKCELRDETGGLRYSAVVERAEAGEPTRTADDAKPQGQWNWAGREYYQDGLLFHGPVFQVIQALGAIGDQGCTATMKSQEANGLPMIFDGGLQLICLWAIQKRGLMVLPAGAGEVRVYHSLRAGEEVSCQVRIEKATSSQVTARIEFTDPGGRLIACLDQVQMFGMPIAAMTQIENGKVAV